MAETQVNSVIVRLNDHFDIEVRHPSGKVCCIIGIVTDATGNTTITTTKGIREVVVKQTQE